MKAKAVCAVTFLILAACSRSGTVYGDVFIPAHSGEVQRAARINVLAVPATEGFEREWSGVLAVFQEEVEPARQAQKVAADSAEAAKLAWDKSLAGRAKVRTAENRLFKAKSRVKEIARKHDAQATSLLDRHMAQRVLTDENGHYILAGVPAGKAYVYARFTVGDRTLVWFRPVHVRSRPQQVDLTAANSGGWPFVP